MSRFLDGRYAPLAAYVPGEQPRDRRYIKLNTNESPYPPAPAVVEAVNRAEAEALNLYPDPSCRALKQALAETYATAPENVFVSNGSDDILNYAFMAYSRVRGVAFPDISYGFYPVYGALFGADALTVPLDEALRVDVEAFCGTGRMTVLANPNAPTGIPVSLAQLERIAASNPDAVTLIDEAYVDFGGESALPLIDRYPNVLCVRTFSKSRSMAGARLGFALGPAALIADLEKLKFSVNPYDVNRITQAAALASLSEPAYTARCCRLVTEERERTAAALSGMGFTVLPSAANFVFARHGRLGGEALYLELKRRGILVRHFSQPRIRDYIRITIGSGEQMRALTRTLRDIIEEALT